MDINKPYPPPSRSYPALLLILLLLPSCIQPRLGGEIMLIRAKPEKGFHYPYYLFIPENTASYEQVYLIIEPNNSGFASDDFDEHVEKAKRIATLEFYAGNYIARNLQYPLLVPAFPRSKSQGQIYTHSLDRDVMLQKNTSLERLDLQLLAMTKDARETLAEMGYTASDQFLMTGFSASGTFANRFTAIHPEKVKAVAAGGINGLLFIPQDTLKNQALTYPVGTYDFQELFGKPFNKNAFKNTPQFLFMGALDDNDAIPYDDAFDPPEREVIYQTLGKGMQPQRWENCQQIYISEGVKAQFRTYEGIGHEQPERIKKDILEFFKKSIE